VNRFEGKMAIVTGSSSGIGQATALRMAAEGAAVTVVADRNVDGGNATVARITAAGGRAVFVQADVSQAADCDRIVSETMAAFGRVDILVNNAGITRGRPLDEMDEEFWDFVLDTNLKSCFMLSRRVVGDMRARGWGRIINVSSVHARATSPARSAYAASKAGICGLTRGLAVELGADGILVNAVLPGTIDVSASHPERAERYRRHREASAKAQVVGRLGTPDEVAAAICFLASEESSFVNGESFTVDGGLLSILRDRLE
jgi:NAD(P)-dependent dehydrogenase (short-subunit alcohol dehydrogenase family)